MWFITLCVAAQLVSAAIDIKLIDRASTLRAVPNSYIVELSKGSHFKRGFASPHEEFYHDLKRRGANWEVAREYSNNLFTGAAVKLGSHADLVKLAEATSVEFIAPVYLHPPPEPVFKRVVRATANLTTLGDHLSTHAMTGVDKLHAEGYFGQGIKIGLIDTGIDYTHPSLGGAFGPGNKVIGGYDFTGDAYTGLPETPPIPDPDPLDHCNGHGTHVAGVIGANPDNPWNISGVAYQSELNAYRVFGCQGSGTDDILIDALLRAHADGNDVINLSLGGPSAWSRSLPAVVASRIAREGRIVTVAVGNRGQYGAWYADSPATGADIISVGSVDNAVIYQQNASVSNGRNITYQSLDALDIPDGLELYATSNDVNSTADACEPLPADTPDLSNRLVIIRSGTCFFMTQIINVAARGGRYFLIYNNVDGPSYAITTGQYSGALISQEDGIFLVQQAIPQNMTVSFPNSAFIIANPTGGLVSPFSSYGPTYDMYLKPAITAPGDIVPSTWPVNFGSWAIASGTSLSSPLVAGAAALLLQARGKTAATAKAARSIFQNSAIPAMRAVNTSLIPTVAQQGAGLLNAYNAIKNSASLLPAELLLNDTAHFRGTHSLEVWNYGTGDITYTFSHVPAGTINTIKGIEPAVGPLELFDAVAIVTIQPIRVTVPAGASASVDVTIKPPVGLDAAEFPVYSGYIKACGSDSSTLHSTYVGVTGRLKDMKVIDDTATYFGNITLPAMMDALGNPIPSNGSAVFSMNATDIPTIFFRLLNGSPLIRFDLIDPWDRHATYPEHVGPKGEENLVEDSSPRPTLPTRSTRDKVFVDRAQTIRTFFPVKTLGVIYQDSYAGRNSADNMTNDGGYFGVDVKEFANSTAIPNGVYRVLFRALKVTGDAGKGEDYESWTSPAFVVRRG